MKAAGVLRVGTEGVYSPFSYHDPATGQLTGYDVDVARAVGEKLGVNVEFVETPWDSIFAALEANRFDVVANQVTITPERQQKYDLSEPYSIGEGVIVTRTDDTSITSLADLKGKVSAQSTTSNWADVARDGGRAGGVGRGLRAGGHAAEPGPGGRDHQRQHRRLRLPGRDRRHVDQDRRADRREERAGLRGPQEQRTAARPEQGARRAAGRRHAGEHLAEVPEGQRIRRPGDGPSAAAALGMAARSWTTCGRWPRPRSPRPSR